MYTEPWLSLVYMPRRHLSSDCGEWKSGSFLLGCLCCMVRSSYVSPLLHAFFHQAMKCVYGYCIFWNRRLPITMWMPQSKGTTLTRHCDEIAGEVNCCIVIITCFIVNKLHNIWKWNAVDKQDKYGVQFDVMFNIKVTRCGVKFSDIRFGYSDIQFGYSNLC